MSSLPQNFKFSALALVLANAVACNPEEGDASAPILVTNAAPANLSETVDPMIGTGGHGHTYPGATAPFGMVQLSPDTRLTGWDGCSGYHVDDDLIYGFSHTHLSGTGVSDYGDVLFMPTTREVELATVDAQSFPFADKFSHEDEASSAGRYQVRLKGGIEVELTASARVGMHRYRFPSSMAPQRVYIDLAHRDKVLDSGLELTGPNEVSGFRRSQGWARDQQVFFVARFSRPIASHQLSASTKSSDADPSVTTHRAVVEFESSDEALVVAVGISSVSIEGARGNLDAEAADLDFDRVRAATTQTWDEKLGRIVVEGGSDEQRTVFYTALYHSLIAPNLFMDVDGQYRGTDLKLHKAEGFNYYTVFSLWDTFRATHPLFTIIERDRTTDLIRTFLAQYKDGGRLPVWELAANYTGTMIGYHAIPVIVDAYFKGIRDFDTHLALEAMVHSADMDHLGLQGYKANGYVAADAEHESVSKTLEYAYDDWCIARMAQDLGEIELAARFFQRAQSYRNLFDPATGFMRARRNGAWVSPFNPAEANIHFTEATAWQYAFFVPQDIAGLVQLLGGEHKFISHLDEAFTSSVGLTGSVDSDISGLIGQYAHGNEPSHHMAYLYAEAGQAWKTQARVRQILNEQYDATPAGLSGNEDCGQMSSWYVLSALGIYSVTPGSDRYVLGAPLFPRATINLENGNNFVIEAPEVSPENLYVNAVTLNGAPLESAAILHGQILAGGVLHFDMVSEPNPDWGQVTAPRDQNIIADPLVEVPHIDAGGSSFEGVTTVQIGHVSAAAAIHYTIDGSTPGPHSPRYEGPFKLSQTSTIQAIAVSGGRESQAVRALIHRRPDGRSVTIEHPYAQQYSAGGDVALIDGIRGGTNWRTGLWQGYQGTEFLAVIDLGRVQKVKRLSSGYLQDMRSWIWMPLEVEYALSMDKKSWKVVATVTPEVDEKAEGIVVRELEAKIRSKKARYVRVRAKSRGPIPQWHRNPGAERFIFVDEITIE